MYFGTRSYLKSNHNHTAKHALNDDDEQWLNNMLFGLIIIIIFILDLNKTNRYT